MALETATQIMAAATELNKIADTARRQLDKLIDANTISNADANRAARKIAAIRDDATDLSLQAASLAIGHLNVTQTDLTQVIAKAHAKLATIQNVAKYVDLVCDVAAFAAAVTTRKPATIVAALNEVRHDIA